MGRIERLKPTRLIAIIVLVVSLLIVVSTPSFSVHYELSYCETTRTRISPDQILVETTCESYNHDGSYIGKFYAWTVVNG